MDKKSAFSKLAGISKWLIVCSAAVSFAAISALYILVSPEWAEGRLLDFSRRNLGMTVRLSGPVTIRHLPKIELTLPSGTFLSEDDGSLLGQFSGGTVLISPWGLLVGQLHVSSLSLEGLSAAVHMPTKSELERMENSPLLQDSNRWIRPVIVRRLALKDASFTLEGVRPEPVRVSVARLDTGEIAPRMTSEISFEATVRSPSDKLEASVAGGGDLDLDLKGRIFGLPAFSARAFGTVGDAPFAAKAGADAFQYVQGSVSGKSASAEISMKGASPGSLSAKLEGLSTRNGVLSGTLSELRVVKVLKDGTQSASASSPFSYDTAQGTWKLGHLESTYTLASDSAPSVDSTVTGSASGSIADWSFEMKAEGTVNDSPLQISASGTARPEAPSFKASLFAKSLNFGRKDDALPAEVSLEGWKTAASDLAAPLMQFAGNASIDAGLRSEEILLGPVRATGFSADISLTGRELSIRKASAGIGSGSLEWQASFRPDRTWKADAKGRKLPVPLAGKQGEGLKGLLSFTLDASGSSAAKGTEEESLAGFADIVLEQGVMPGLGEKPLAFSELSGKLNFRGGIASADAFRISGKDFSARGHAEIDLRTLALAGEAKVEGPRKQESGATLDGSLIHPSWSLTDPIDFSLREESESQAPQEEAAKQPAEPPARQNQEASTPGTAAETGKSSPSPSGFFSRAIDWVRSRL